MKKKAIVALLAIFCLTSVLTFFTACSHKHSYTNVIVSPTCTEKGYTIHTCDCNESYTDSYVDAKGHAYTSTVTAPTCTENGYTTYACACGESYTADEAKALGHEYSNEWTIDKAATCLDQGEKSHHCIRCESRIDVTMTEYGAHNYVNDVCIVCGEPAVTEATDLDFELSEDETYYVVTGIGSETRTRFVIPSAYNGKPVQEIAKDAFSQESTKTNDDILPIKEVVIPASVKSVGAYAFYMCAKLESLTFLGNAELSVGEHAFEYCTMLKNVTIAGAVDSIDNFAFRYCYAVENVYVNDIETWLGIKFGYGANPTAYAKNLCVNKKLLRNLVIPSTITEIRDYAFYCVPSLKSVTLHASVTSIGAFAFDGCENLQFNEFDDAWYLGTSSNSYFALIKFQSDTKTSCKINENTKIVAGSAFYACEALQTITIPENIKAIEKYTFANCENLATVHLADNLSFIGDYAFESCKKLASINFTSGIKQIGNYAFAYCDGLTSVKIPDNVMSVGSYAFYNCKNLESVEIRTGGTNAANQVTEIGEYAFQWCEKLTNVLIRRGVFKLSVGMCENCAELTNVTLSVGLTSIDEYAFRYCDKLVKIDFTEGTAEEWKAITKAKNWKDDNAKFIVYYKDSKSISAENA